MYPRIKTIIAEAGLDSGGAYDNSSGGGSSPASPGTTESDGSSSADELCPPDLTEFRRHASPLHLSSARGNELDRDCIRQASAVSASGELDVDDIHSHHQRMLLLLPAFASTADADAAARAEALLHWLSAFDVAWVLDMDASALPQRELGRRVAAWARALSTMERVFRLRHRELAPAQAAALGELAAASAGAMLTLASAVAALGSSPSTLLAALDMYAPLSETYPVLARLFSWGPSHPVSAAAEATLAGLVDAARRCRHDLAASFIRSHYPWRMPQGGEVHPCVAFWMGYFRCLLRNRVTLYFVLGNDDDGDGEAPPPPLELGGGGEGGLGLGLVGELIACLEAVLEEKSAALAFPGLRQVFMLNNTFTIVRRVMRSDLKLFLPPGWVRAREERMEGYIKGYMDASWAPVVSRLDDAGGGTKPTSSAVLRRRSNRLSAFYSALENACSAQRCWKVPNPVIRGFLRRRVLDNIGPAYRRYLEDHPEAEVGSGRSAEELDQQLSDLFEG